MDKQAAWDRFCSSGSIDDYMSYRSACMGEPVGSGIQTGGAGLADTVRRSGGSGKATGGARQAADSAHP